MSLPVLSIRAKITLLICLFSSMMIIYCFISSRTNNHVKINGELYTEIIKGKDLLADILPPPEYLIESYLLSNRLLFVADVESREETIKKMEQLQKDYSDRQTYWMESLEQGEIKRLITNDSKIPAEKFFASEQELIKCIRNGDRAKAESILNGELTVQYDLHRAAIDVLVEKSTNWAATNEKAAADMIEKSSYMLIGIAILAIIAGLVFGYFISKSIVEPIKAAIRYAASIAKGNLD